MDTNQKSNSLKAVVIGGSGATGRELIQELIQNPKWSEICIITRRVLDEWKNLSPEQQKKLKIIEKEDLDDLKEPSKWELNGYDSFFCCLGTRTKYGQDNFIKVDKVYPVQASRLASYFKIPHYSVLSSGKSDSSSMFYYFQIKGNMEDEVKKENIPHISIFRPGLITNRKNDFRFGEYLASFIPFIDKIESKDIGRSMMYEAQLQHEKPQNKNILSYDNDQMNFFAKNQGYPTNM